MEIKLAVKSFITHKKAESREDCQDAFFQNEKMARYAVADGATRSFCAKEWAELLVEHFCEESIPYPTTHSWQSWLNPIQEKWYMRVARKVRERPLYFLVNPFTSKEPAASTFIGLEFDKTEASWKAMIVGDSCVFQIGNCRFKSYLINKSTDFTSYPAFLASYEKDNHSEPSFVKGCASHGDTLILATDALAHWILRHKEAGRRDEALNELKMIEDENQFHEFVDRARSDEAIRLVNDDVTLMILSVEQKQDVEAENDQPTTISGSGIETETYRLSATLRLLFWTFLTGMFGILVGALVAFLLLWFNID